MTLFSCRRALGITGRTARRFVVPRCEVLEDRTVPSSTFTVMNLHDSGPGSLRDAIAMANANPGADTIVFASGLQGTIHLVTGELLITDSVTINGPGVRQLSISGGLGLGLGFSRVFEFAGGTTDSISGLSITGGNGVANNPKSASGFGGFGGGILNLGSLTITNCNIFFNRTLFTGFSGGAIDNEGSLTVSDSTLSGNSSAWSGGAIANSGTLMVSGSTLSDNQAFSYGGGGIANGGTLIVSGSTLSDNQAFGGFSGGGIDNEGTLTVNASILSNNSASSGGGISNDLFSTSMTISSSTLSHNSASDGGGLYNIGTLQVSDCTLSGNSASHDGGAIYNDARSSLSFGTVTADGCTLSGNGAVDSGGGIFNNVFGGSIHDLTPSYARVLLIDSTLSGNLANNNGGGIANFGALTLVVTDVSGNFAGLHGGDLYENRSGGATLFALFSSITDLYYA
jgi:predicted outer membrane repeat protein